MHRWGFAHALDDNFQHPDREVRVLFEQSPEIPSHQLEATGALFCGDSGRADTLLHQSHLAKELSWAHAPQALTLAGHIHASVRDEKEADARFTLLHDYRPRLVDALFDRARNELQLSSGQRAEDGDLLQIGERCAPVGHLTTPGPGDGVIRRRAKRYLPTCAAMTKIQDRICEYPTQRRRNPPDHFTVEQEARCRFWGDRVRALVVWVGVAVTGAFWPHVPIVDAARPLLIALSSVSHTLDGATLTVTGWVVNGGQAPLSRLVIDVHGFAPSGDLTAFGSDGIPWDIPPGGAERFTVSLVVPAPLIRDYTVTVSSARAWGRPLAGVRRRVNSALYRALVVSRVRVAAHVRPGRLTLRTDVGGMPVAQITVEATLVVFNPHLNLLQSLTVVMPPDATETFSIDGTQAALVSLRVVDLLLTTAWD